MANFQSRFPWLRVRKRKVKTKAAAVSDEEWPFVISDRRRRRELRANYTLPLEENAYSDLLKQPSLLLPFDPS